MRWGYSYELGPFEVWDSLGVHETVEAMKANNVAVAPWVTEMLDAGNESFYRSHHPLLSYYDPAGKTYIAEALLGAAPREREGGE